MNKAPSQQKSNMQQAKIPRPKLLLGLVMLLSLLWSSLLTVAPFTQTSSAAGGDYSLDFQAAAPLSYTHAAGGGAWNDGTNAEDGDIRPSLAPDLYACGDIVTFLVEISVANPAAAETIEIDFQFGANTTSGSGVGFTETTYVGINYGEVENGDGGTPPGGGPGTYGLDSGIVDNGNSTATLDTVSGYTGIINGPALQGNAILQARVNIDGLEASDETVILRIDNRIECAPGGNPGGTLQSSIDAARVIDPSPDTISVGNQTVPMLQPDNLQGVGEPLVSLTKTVAPSDGTCGVDDVDYLTSFPGETVKYCYVVTNTGTDPLFDVVLMDDNGTPGVPGDDFTVTLTGLTDEDGDTNADDLAAGGTATGEVSPVTVPSTSSCTHLNIATVAGDDNGTGTFSDSDDATVFRCYDFGDHPTSIGSGYLVTYAEGGPRHVVYPDTDGDNLPNSQLDSPAIWLGDLIDVEPDGAHSFSNNDDNTGANDEDGVLPLDAANWRQFDTEYVRVTLSSSTTVPTTAYLVIWFDWDYDGVLEAGEITVSETVTWTTSTTQDFDFIVPTFVDPTKDLYYRARLFETASSSPSGLAINGEVEDNNIPAGTTQVSVSYFQVSHIGQNVRFEWQTAMEAGNLGFNIYEQTSESLQRINEELIPSNVVDSDVPQDYVYDAGSVSGNVFFIEDVDFKAQARMHGPFELGESFGAKVKPDPIDWAAIRAEHDLKEAQRDAQARELIAAALREDAESNADNVSSDNIPVKQVLSSNDLSHIFLPMITTDQGGNTDPPPKDDIRINLIVAENGLYRVTYEDLKNAGFDLLLQNPAQLALLNQGQPVPMRVEAQWAIGPGDFIEFYGLALDTFYTDKNVYTLVFNRDQALRVVDDETTPSNVTPETYYMETVMIENEIEFSQLSPIGDPWFDTRFVVYTTPQSWTVDIDIDHYVSNVMPSTLLVSMWGSSEWYSWFTGNNHHVQVSLNNSAPIKDMYYKGIVDASFEEELPASLLQNGVNELTFTLPGDTGVSAEHSVLNNYGISYAREFVARDGMLAFEAAGEVFRVDGLPSNTVLVYRMSNGMVTRLTDVQVSGLSGNYSATFAGSTEAAKYVVVAAPALKSPNIEPGRPYSDITSGTADFIMIAHPDFKAGLADLVTAREAQGYTVKVVDVEDVYAQFSYEIFDAQAIKDYVTFAQQNMGTTYFLLVGGDTIDYRGYLGTGGISFIPSLYAYATEGAHFAPADPLYGDVNDDGVPDVALGRFIARSSAELKLLIDKTLAYENKDYGKKATFAADVGFGPASDSMIATMPVGWDVTRVYLDAIADEAVAKQFLLAAINNKTALTSYVGHSGSQHWSSGLLTSTDVEGLTNVNAPTVVTQWGCYNTYYVSPAYNTMAHKFLISGDAGAAAVMGGTALTLATSEQALGEQMLPRLVTPGMTIGDAILIAKQQAVASSGSDLTDVLVGWTLLGDPTLVIDP